MSEQFDQYANNYDNLVNSALSATGERKDYFAQARAQWLAKYLNKGATTVESLLDYGCGNGANAPALIQELELASLVGVDVSAESIAAARRNVSGNASFCTLDEYTPAAQMDIAYCCGVFHHIAPTSRATALDYIYRSLRPGGLFAFFEHNPWNPGTRHIMANCEFDHDAITISPPESLRLLRSAGFGVEDRQFLFFFPALLSFLRPIESALRKVPLGGQYVVMARKSEA